MLEQKKSRLKRLPENSHTIILKFEKKRNRDDCLNSGEFQKILGELSSLISSYNSKIETIEWDIVTGKQAPHKKNEKNE
ncbi:MAG: hypothetical protein ACTSRI_02025 [Promethearchaeota archaeon]